MFLDSSIKDLLLNGDLSKRENIIIKKNSQKKWQSIEMNNTGGILLRQQGFKIIKFISEKLTYC